MTFERLEAYRSIKRQIEDYERNNDISVLGAVDYTKPVVQSGKAANMTANTAIKRCLIISRKEYDELCKEFELLNDYIYSIENVTTREIFKLKFIDGYKLEEIAEKMNYSRAGIYKKLKKYIKNH